MLNAQDTEKLRSKVFEHLGKDVVDFYIFAEKQGFCRDGKLSCKLCLSVISYLTERGLIMLRKQD